MQFLKSPSFARADLNSFRSTPKMIEYLVDRRVADVSISFSARNQESGVRRIDDHTQKAERIDRACANEGVPPSKDTRVLFRVRCSDRNSRSCAKHGYPPRAARLIAEGARLDAFSFLRVVVNPSDTLSWFRALKLIDNIGDADGQPDTRSISASSEKEFRSAPRKKDFLRNGIASLLVPLQRPND